MIDTITWQLTRLNVHLANYHRRLWPLFNYGPYAWWILYIRDPLKRRARKKETTK